VTLRRQREAADARLTAERQETKYVLPSVSAQTLARALAQKLPTHRYEGDGANRLPRPHHFVTTIYFDTPSRDLYRAAVGSDSNLKLRAKEYYDLHPSLAEVATHPRQLVRFHPVLWLEVKHKAGSRTGKHRLGIPKTEVPEFFASGRVTAEMIEIQEAAHGKGAGRWFAEVAQLCRRYREPFQANNLVNYRRLAWQDDEADLRVTLDVNLAFYAPPADLWSREHALVRDTLGVPAGTEARCILEVKTRGDLPAWLGEVLRQTQAEPIAYSKFEEASRALHG